MEKPLHQSSLDFLKKKFKEDDIEIFPLTGDASERTYYRLKLKKSTLILLQDKPFIKEKENFSYINIRDHLSRFAIPVPQIFLYIPELGIILVEDFGDLTLEEFVKNNPERDYEKYYLQAINILLDMQVKASQREANCRAFLIDFNVAKFMKEFNFATTYLIEKHFKKKIKTAERKILDQGYLEIAEHLHQQKKYFTHRDYHSRNLIIKDGQLRLLDFQDARLGPCHYDLASLLRDAYVFLAEDFVTDLISYYLKKKETLEKERIDRNKFFKTLDLMSFQRSFFAAGVFAYHANREGGTDRYLKYIPHTLEHLKKSLEKQAELAKIKKIFSNYWEWK